MTSLASLSRFVSVVRVGVAICLAFCLPTTAHAQSEAVEYYGLDALGSVRLVFDASGNVLGRMDYGPFGEELAPSTGKQQRIYAGLFMNEEARLAHAEARSYQVRTGRFSTVDAEYAGIFEPQRWNRYAYVRNSPLVSIDPSGNGDCQPGSYWCPGSTAGPPIDIGLHETVNVVAKAPPASAPSPSGYSLATAIGLALASVATQPSAIPGYSGPDWAHILATRTAPGIVISDVKQLVSPDSSNGERAEAAVGIALLAVPEARVLKNREIGNAFRDELAARRRKAGREVETEVPYWTPFGRRYIDIEVKLNGQIVGGIETKVGSSRYTVAQQVKDWYLKTFNGYIVNVARKP